MIGKCEEEPTERRAPLNQRSHGTVMKYHMSVWLLSVMAFRSSSVPVMNTYQTGSVLCHIYCEGFIIYEEMFVQQWWGLRSLGLESHLSRHTQRLDLDSQSGTREQSSFVQVWYLTVVSSLSLTSSQHNMMMNAAATAQLKRTPWRACPQLLRRLSTP